jgi:hypothetical protein
MLALVQPFSLCFSQLVFILVGEFLSMDRRENIMLRKVGKLIGWILLGVFIAGLFIVGSFGVGIPITALMIGSIAIILVGMASLYLILG